MKYVASEMNVELFENVDVITASGAATTTLDPDAPPVTPWG